MNEDCKMEFPVEAVPDDLNQYLKNIERMKRIARINRAANTFSDRYSFRWYYESESVLPDEQRQQISELLKIGDGVRFSLMDSTLKHILWKGVRFYYGLAENEFPFPDVLRNMPEPLGQRFVAPVSGVSKPAVWRQPRNVAVALAMVGGFFLGLFVGTGPDVQHSPRDSQIQSSAPLLKYSNNKNVHHEIAEPEKSNARANSD